MKLRPFVCLEAFGIGSHVVFDTQQLAEHQIEDVHHASCNLGNENQHFHRHKNSRNFDTKGKKAKNVVAWLIEHENVVFLSKISPYGY